MKIEYIDPDQEKFIINEQIEEIALLDFGSGNPAVILTLDDGQKIFISTSEWASIYKYKG